MVPYLALTSVTRTTLVPLRHKGLLTEAQCNLVVSSASRAQSTVRMRH